MPSGSQCPQLWKEEVGPKPSLGSFLVGNRERFLSLLGKEPMGEATLGRRVVETFSSCHRQLLETEGSSKDLEC